jgi:hypothetical protein
MTQLNRNKVVLKVDISNTYNAISRIAILEAVRHIPEILPYSHFALYEDTQVFFTSKDKTVSLLVPMKTGCPQGSPLSTRWFNLTQGPMGG